MTIKFTVLPPNGWRQVRLDPQHRGKEAALAAKQLCSAAAGLPSVSQRQLRELMEKPLAQAWDTGTRLLMTSTPDNSDVASIVASYTVGFLPLAVPGGSIEENLAHISSHEMSERAELIDGEKLDVAGCQHPQLGLGVQSASIRYMRNENDEFMPHRVATLRVFLVFGSHLVLATGVTPQIELADVLFQLFAKITSTLRVEDSETQSAEAASSFTEVRAAEE